MYLLYFCNKCKSTHRPVIGSSTFPLKQYSKSGGVFVVEWGEEVGNAEENTTQIKSIMKICFSTAILLKNTQHFERLEYLFVM